MSRARLARDALRFGFLGAMLLYAFVPPMFSEEQDLLGLRTLRPGPWAGALAGAACVLGGILFSAGPAWRSTFQAPRWCVNLQFYASALGAIAVFGALMTASYQADSGSRPPALATGGGALMVVGAALLVVNVTLAIRSHRQVRSTSADT